jgi:cytochrome c peroxidase
MVRFFSGLLNKRSVKKRCSVLFFTGLFITSLSLKVSATEPLSTPDISDIEYPEDEAPTLAEINLGKLLFFDKRLSANGTTSCASCHKPEHGFGDGLKLSIGSEGNTLTRHTPHLYNLAWSSILFWDGRASTLEQQALMPISNPEEMNLSEEKMLSRVIATPQYRAQFERVYNEKNIDAPLVSRALSAFMRSIVSNNSPFDRYLAGDGQALSAEALNGLKLFEGKAQCIECHDGPNLTDDSFHSLGIAVSDKGRGYIIKEPAMYYRFKTPGLRNVELTAPYMHDGSLADLEAVLQFYNDGGGLGPNKDKLMKPLNLQKHEIRDLISFLSTLTDPVRIDRPNLPEFKQTVSNSQ